MPFLAVLIFTDYSRLNNLSLICPLKSTVKLFNFFMHIAEILIFSRWVCWCVVPVPRKHVWVGKENSRANLIVFLRDNSPFSEICRWDSRKTNPCAKLHQLTYNMWISSVRCGLFACPRNLKTWKKTRQGQLHLYVKRRDVEEAWYVTWSSTVLLLFRSV